MILKIKAVFLYQSIFIIHLIEFGMLFATFLVLKNSNTNYIATVLSFIVFKSV